ncbi:stress response protein Nst1 [Pseudohyphozyma bogoriensis]|nr:stress response protein Nst1 [Pseudohyphozyma bogoriensis]
MPVEDGTVIGPDAAVLAFCKALEEGAAGCVFLDGVTKSDVLGAWDDLEELGAGAWYEGGAGGGVIVTLSGATHGSVASAMGVLVSDTYKRFFERGSKDFLVVYDSRSIETYRKKPDFSIFVRMGDHEGAQGRQVACFVFEVSRAQGSPAAVEKVEKLVQGNEAIVGGLVINLDTTPELDLKEVEMTLIRKVTTQKGTCAHQIFYYLHEDPTSTPPPPINRSVTLQLTDIFPPKVIERLHASGHRPASFTMSPEDLEDLLFLAREGLAYDLKLREMDKVEDKATRVRKKAEADQRIKDKKVAETKRKQNRKKTIKKLERARARQ